MDVGPFTLRCGLWEVKVYDEANVTGLTQRHHEKAEFRYYDDIWKSAMDKIQKMATEKPPRKPKRRPQGNKKDRDGLDYDPDFDPENDAEEIEHFKTGENWFTLPNHIPNTVWDRENGKLSAAEVLFTLSWLATFSLMCLFAFHQFVPSFHVTLTVMRLFCAALFGAGFFVLIAVACYGSAVPPICESITEFYEKSPNPKFALAARGSDCSFSGGYSIALFSGIFLIIVGILTALNIRQKQLGGEFDITQAAGAALNFGKSFIGGGAGGADGNVPNRAEYDWREEPTTAYSGGYDQGSYQAGGTGGDWERLQ